MFDTARGGFFIGAPCSTSTDAAVFVAWRALRRGATGTPALLRRATARRERPPCAIGIEAKSGSEFRVPLLIFDPLTGATVTVAVNVPAHHSVTPRLPKGSLQICYWRGAVFAVSRLSTSESTTVARPYGRCRVVSIIGAVCFGIVIGWVTYRTLRRRGEVVALSDIASVIGAVGGGWVTTQFSVPEVFGSYCVGLFVGFFAYLILGVTYFRDVGWLSSD
jgi:uncharacterized membrane protein YeaQ/YmgE (transglycosylase-associated protein family)